MHIGLTLIIRLSLADHLPAISHLPECLHFSDSEDQPLRRYVCVSRSLTMWQYIRLLRPSQSSRHRLALGQGPYALFWAIFR